MLVPRHIEFYELTDHAATRRDALSLRELASPQPQPHEDKIIEYLTTAPNYCAMGKAVGDVLNPQEDVALFPGTNTDGLYFWPMELAYYVRKYHVRLPQDFIARMAALNWKPPSKERINWNELYDALAEKGDR